MTSLPDTPMWEERFERQFVADNGTSWKMPIGAVSPESIRQFIRQELESARAEQKEEDLEVVADILVMQNEEFNHDEIQILEAKYRKFASAIRGEESTL